MMWGPLTGVSLFLLVLTTFHLDHTTALANYVFGVAFLTLSTGFFIGMGIWWRLVTPVIELHPDCIIASSFFFDRKALGWAEVRLIKDVRRPSGTLNNGRLRSFQIVGGERSVGFNELYTHCTELLMLINEQIAQHHIKVLVQRFPPLNAPSPRVPKEQSVTQLELEIT